MEAIAPYYKSLTASVVSFLALVVAALLGSSDGGSTITAHEWVTAFMVALLTGAAVHLVPNRDPAGTHQLESVQKKAVPFPKEYPNEPSREAPYQGKHRKPLDEEGAWEGSSLLFAIACIVVIAVGIVWLFQAF